jgi:hypothetical protein
VRFAISLLLLAGCLSNDIPETSFAAVPGTPAIKFSRSTTGITNYGGTAYYQWNIILASTEGCAGDTAARFEINTPVVGSPNAFPTGVIPIRADQIPSVLPSALATADAATGVSGSITIDSVEATRITGSLDATMTTGPMTGSFIAFSCQ